MPPRPDPPVPPTLAARLTDDALCSCPECGADHRVNVTTPEPVTPPVAVAVPEVLGVNDFEDRVRHLLPDGVVPSADQMRRELIAMGEPQPAPSSVPVPADDERGLAVDLLDVDRLRLIADSLVFGPRMRALRDLADRLAAQITETLSLRESLRKAEQERDALRTALEKIRPFVIVGVTAGANPQKGGGMSPPLWHMNCRVCDARWSKTVWKEPFDSHPDSACWFNTALTEAR